MKRMVFLVLMILPCFVLADSTKIVTIDGMTCPSCAVSVESEMKKLSSVKTLTIQLSSGTVELTIADGGEVPRKDIEKAVAKAGFKVISIK